MIPAPFRVVLDANVLFPFVLRDTLLRAADAHFYQLYWTSEILDEVTRNLVSTGIMSEAKARRLRAAMTDAFPEAEIVDYEHLIPAMRNAKADRHVVAAAVAAGAQVIVTSNLSDFHNLPSGIEALSPDALLCNLFDLAPSAFVELLRNQATDLGKPAVTFEELLSSLSRSAPKFARAVRAHLQGQPE